MNIELYWKLKKIRREIKAKFCGISLIISVTIFA